MKLAIAIFTIALVPMQVMAESIETQLFSLELNSGWAEDDENKYPASPTNSFHLTFKSGNALATVSAASFSERNAEAVATAYLDLRTSAEREEMEAAGRSVSFEQSIHEKDGSYQIDYYGKDSSSRTFRFWGFVRSNKLINIYVESYELDESAIEQPFRALLAGLAF